MARRARCEVIAGSDASDYLVEAAGDTLRSMPGRSMFASVRVAMLLLVAPALGCATDVSFARSVEFEGRVVAGEKFIRSVGDRFRFVLAPIEHGWMIQVLEATGSIDLSRLTPPYHFVPNPRYLEGWHFRDSENTGPNEPGPNNVNAPQQIREFVFSPEVADMGRQPTAAEVDRIQEFGSGQLEILDFGLRNLDHGERAMFAWLRFRVELGWCGCTKTR